jgi:hypothetical protein
MSDDPYRSPVVPAATEAEQRLRERLDRHVEEGARRREAARTRRVHLRRALFAMAGLSLLWLITCVVLSAGVGISAPWIGASMVVCGIATPMAFVFAFGTKIPPRPGDAPSVVSPSRVS